MLLEGYKWYFWQEIGYTINKCVTASKAQQTTAWSSVQTVWEVIIYCSNNLSVASGCSVGRKLKCQKYHELRTWQHSYVISVFISIIFLSLIACLADNIYNHYLKSAIAHFILFRHLQSPQYVMLTWEFCHLSFVALQFFLYISNVFRFTDQHHISHF